MYLSLNRLTVLKLWRFGRNYLQSVIRFIYFYVLLRCERKERFDIRIRDFHICLRDATGTTGFDRHYVYHTSWAARVIAETRPKEHFDFSSSLYFVGIVSAFVPIHFFDYRPASLGLSNLTSASADLIKLPFDSGSLYSISCMHVVEHIGLGRYGDSLDYDGDIKAARELSRILAIGGQLLFVVPVGERSIINFNAHRVYTYDHVLSLFPDLYLVEFSLINESMDTGLLRHADPAFLVGEKYACGCFLFKKVR